MGPASIVAILVFSVVALSHLVRLIFQLEVLVAGVVMPMWVSVLGLVVAGGLAVALWQELRPRSLPEEVP